MTFNLPSSRPQRHQHLLLLHWQQQQQQQQRNEKKREVIRTQIAHNICMWHSHSLQIVAYTPGRVNKNSALQIPVGTLEAYKYKLCCRIQQSCYIVINSFYLCIKQCELLCKKLNKYYFELLLYINIFQNQRNREL